MNCLLCNNNPENYCPEPDKDFICSQCVQLLLSAEQAELKRAHSKAIEKGYSNKARAIESFLLPEDINVNETKQARRNLVRKRHMRTVRPSRNQLRTKQAAV
jgi:hypothetical protein